MKMIKRFTALGEKPKSRKATRDLLELAFEEGDMSGAVKAYRNVAEQIEAADTFDPELMVKELRRWAGSLEGRRRRANADLAARGWTD